jgi:predicted metal-dependent hydrolase
MSKAQKIAAMVAGVDGGGRDPHYAGYFAYFNEGKFYEAHDVLEHIWLPQRHGANGNFFKGLIQLAGAFVHLQKDRLGPAAALFKLARKNLAPFPPLHEHLDVSQVLALIESWLAKLEAGGGNPLSAETRPKLALANPRRTA